MTHDEAIGRIKAALAERGLHIPDIVERIGAIGDPTRLEQIAKSDMLLDLFATSLSLQSDYLRRIQNDLTIVSAQSDEALQKLTVTLGLRDPGKTPDGETA